MVEGSLHLITQKDCISAFTSLRNSKAMWYAHFMVIRHKGRRGNRQREREMSVGKHLGTPASKHMTILPIDEEVASLHQALKQTTHLIWLSMNIFLSEISKAIL